MCLILVPYVWEEIKNTKELEESRNKPKEIHPPDYIDWIKIFPEDYEPKFKFHTDTIIFLVIGLGVSLFLTLVGYMMHKFYGQLKQDVQELNDREVTLNQAI